MALFADLRARRLARQAEEVFARAGFAAAATHLDSSDGLGGAPWAHFAVALYNQGKKEDAERAIRRALEVEPGRGDALIFLAEVLAESAREPEAIEAYRELLRRFPGAGSSAVALARLLRRRHDFAGVREVLAPFAGHSQEALMALAQAHYELDDHDAVLALLGPAVERMRLEMRQGLFGGADGRELHAAYQDASRLYSEAYAARHGREAVIESPVVAGDLDPRSATNFRLFGEARLAHPPAWEPDTELRSVDDGLAFGEALIRAGERSRGACHVGLARLRQGKVDEARKRFAEARDLDDDNFAAYLGLAAAMELEAARAFSRLRELPDRPPPPLVEEVVVDWPALTALERKVVALVVAPVAAALPRILAGGGEVRLLPVDARLIDLPEMAGPPHERADDHRCLEAITGAATARVAASKIEELLALTGERDSVFAHELAHLVHFHLPAHQCRRIDELYARAMEHGHVATDYQTTNAAEFFAVAYTDFIAHEYDLPSKREHDDEGILEQTFDFIRSLAAGRPQDPAPPYPYLVEEVTLTNEAAGVTLAGTLTRPAHGRPSPAVLLVPGSGAQDRDEWICGHRPFLVLADHLTRAGVAVLRLDDRGVGGSTGDKNDCTHDDLLGDVQVALDFLRGHAGVDRRRVGVIGHSEGASIAAAAAGRSPEAVAFVVLLACATGMGAEVLHEQSRALSREGGATEEQIAHERRMNDAVFAVLARGLDDEATRAALLPLFTEALRGWPGGALVDDLEEHAATMADAVVPVAFRFFVGCDLGASLTGVRCPVLALYGERDLQVVPGTNLPRLRERLAAAGNTRVTAEELPSLNHLFQTAKTGALSEYDEIDETIAPQVLERVRAWILSVAS